MSKASGVPIDIPAKDGPPSVTEERATTGKVIPSTNQSVEADVRGVVENACCLWDVDGLSDVDVEFLTGSGTLEIVGICHSSSLKIKREVCDEVRFRRRNFEGIKERDAYLAV